MSDSNSYIVLLKRDAQLGDHKNWIEGLAQPGVAGTDSSSPVTVQREYKNLNGYAATNLSDGLLRQVSENSDVRAVVPNRTHTIQMIRNDGQELDDGAAAHAHALAAGAQAPGSTWGLQRISQPGRLPANAAPLRLNYTYNVQTAQSNVDVDCYIVDTGVKINHQDFGGRARWGENFTSDPAQDGQGHGTHVGATVAGNRWGVAKSANIIAVKVLGDNGSGSSFDIVAGIDWCVDEHNKKKRELGEGKVCSVINMSLGGGGPDQALDEAVENAVNAGIHVVVAAGNDAVDAGNDSPARAPGAITVGATHIRDERSNFSNWGSTVKIFAPGSGVISAGITSTTAYIAHDGTSMASPHVAGVVAHRLANNPSITPAQMLQNLQNSARPGILQNIYDGQSPNLLLQV